MLDNIIKIDIDIKPFPVNEFINRWLSIEEITDLKIKLFRLAKTNKGYHVYMKINQKVNSRWIILFQLILLSDYRRELYNIKRVASGVKDWNVLFSKKVYKKYNYVSEEKEDKEMFNKLNTLYKITKKRKKKAGL